MIKQFLIELKPQPISLKITGERKGYFTESFAVSSGGENNPPVLQTFATSMISATS